MPGRHAPASSKSFLMSLAAAVGGALAALAVVVGIALVALNAGNDDETPSAPTLGARTTPPATRPATTATTPPATVQPSTPSTARPPSQTTLRILNGTNRPGLARQMAARAKQEGYPEAKVGNSPRTAKSTIYFKEGARAEAEEFQRRFEEFTEIAPSPSSFATDVLLTIVVGEDYPGAASPTPTS